MKISSWKIIASKAQKRLESLETGDVIKQVFE